jgi:hypothetical protein
MCWLARLTALSGEVGGASQGTDEERRRDEATDHGQSVLQAHDGGDDQGQHVVLAEEGRRLALLASRAEGPLRLRQGNSTVRYGLGHAEAQLTDHHTCPSRAR